MHEEIAAVRFQLQCSARHGIAPHSPSPTDRARSMAAGLQDRLALEAPQSQRPQSQVYKGHRVPEDELNSTDTDSIFTTSPFRTSTALQNSYETRKPIQNI